MRVPRGVDLLPAPVAAMLGPGERALSWEPVTNLAQATRVGGGPRPEVGFSWDPVVGGIEANPEWVGGLVAGYAAGGENGSLGHQLERGIERIATTYVLLTSRRLLLLGEEVESPVRSSYHATFAVDRASVRSIDLAPRLLQWGRVRVSFTDDSWGMLVMGIVLRGAARRLIAAVGAERPA